MSPAIVRPAALVTQGNLRLFTTSLRVEHLMIPNFYTIERLDPDAPNDKGYQRLLNKGRAKKLADYLLDGQDSHDAFLPTSIFFATDKNIPFDESTNTISFDVGTVGPFSVVDGQHRLEGLKLAAEKRHEINSFEVPVNIAANLPRIAQMCHFPIVNTTQKSVDKAVEQRIYARLTEATDFEDVPNLPKWIRRIVESGDDEQALRIVDHLNTAENSSWRNKIEMANEPDSKGKTISQGSFVKAVKSVKPPMRRPETYRVYGSFIEGHIAKATIATVPLQRLRGSDIERFYADLPLAPSSLTVLNALIHRASRKAVKDRLLTVNPAVDLERRKPEKDVAVQQAQQHCWTAIEARRVIDTAKTASLQLAAFVYLALDSGARKSELHGLCWSDLDLETGTLTIARQLDSTTLTEAGAVNFGPTKTKQRRTITLGPETVAQLRAHKRHQAALKMKNRGVYRDFGLLFAKEEIDLQTPGARSASRSRR